MATEIAVLERQALSLPEQARAITIKTKVDYLIAAEFCKGAKQLLDQIAEVFNPIDTAQIKARKETITQRKRLEEGPVQALYIGKKAMAAWDTEQERIRLAEQRRLEELARKAEEERQLAEALAAEASGDNQTAEAILAEEPARPVVILQKETPKVEGVSYRENWTFEFTNRALLPREYLIPDEVKIGQVVRAMKEQTNIPGVRAYSKKGTNIR